jgi:hypothetical protein
MADAKDMKETEEEFVRSWLQIELFYKDMLAIPLSSWHWLKPLVSLIGELKQKGYDTQFRAGHSIYYFILSRSREHGLRADQHFLQIEPGQNGGMMLDYFTPEGKESTEVSRTEFCPELEAMLLRLISQPID